MVAEPTAEEKAPATCTTNRSEGWTPSQPVLNGGAGTCTPDKSGPQRPIGLGCKLLGREMSEYGMDDVADAFVPLLGSHARINLCKR